MSQFNRNNLDKAYSPYLQKHKHNPIFWQEWSADVARYAQEQKKPLLISVGYATCHWCHAMAHDTFQDAAVADYLNTHFINVKVDREQRPDIDHYMMSFALLSQSGGGWPLNVVLTPDLKPFAACTYLPAQAANGMPAFLDVMKRAHSFYQQNSQQIQPFMPPLNQSPDIAQAEGIQQLIAQYDSLWGGFGDKAKFPPYTTLIYLLHYFEQTQDQLVYGMLKKTLDTMAQRGLHDHLQGGFFRYCVDRSWTIPHFEKVVCDQGLALWVYSLAYKVLHVPTYKTVAEGIMRCLQDCFYQDGLYAAAIDADTQDQEGSTYLWDYQELETALGKEAFQEFNRLYQISPEGNLSFDTLPSSPRLRRTSRTGANHLIKTRTDFLPTIEQTLLTVRNKKAQPGVDAKKITSWNALVGIGFVMAHRYLQDQDAFKKAQQIFERLVGQHSQDAGLTHSSLNNKAQKEAFLQDIASMLLLATYLQEEAHGYDDVLIQLLKQLDTYHDNTIWYEGRNTDFFDIPAAPYDQAMPASTALAQLALIRASYLHKQTPTPHAYKQPLAYDFLNLCAWSSTGNTYIIESPELIAWKELPINSMQRKAPTIAVIKDAERIEFNTVDDLITRFVL